MAEIKIPLKAKFFCGIIFSNKDKLNLAIEALETKYGTIDLSCGPFPFAHTDYYEQMGSNLSKYFISFETLFDRENICDMKIFCNSVELNLSESNDNKKRIINIDPGYLTNSNVFLASCKEYYHRMYLQKGIYLENELCYSKKKFNFFEWTYPDYKSEEYLNFFYKLREKYRNQIWYLFIFFL